MLEQIPTPKEFRDAIESLSPEQQRFAKAFRGMQLESTLFAVCVIQIKPQLEKLLKLPPDSLTKEIRMTQELLNLFLEYQIPSDLLSYDGPADAPTDAKLERVNEYIRRMHEMIELSKARELEQEREREAMRLAQMDRSVPPPSPGPLPFGGPPAMPGGMPMPASAPMRSAASMPRSGAAPGGPPPIPSAAPPPMMSAPPMPSAPVPQPMQVPPQSVQPAQPVPQQAQAVSATSPQPARDTAASPTPPPGDIGDYTRIPVELDRQFERLDTDGALRATIINPGDPWTRTAQKGLLGAATTTTLPAADQRTEKNRAFDLLDALSKSGALPIDDASLHVVIAATHCFDRTLLDTVIQDNVNPIEKVERSLMIVGTTIHGQPAAALLADDQRDRFFTTTPQLGSASDKGPPGDGATDA
jgi:hypothetical protein